MVDTAKILEERKGTHGEYADHARCTQAILQQLRAERNWPTLPDMMKESLHMIAHKMARIVTGTPGVKDHWDDIAGYAVLISQRIERPVEAYPSDDVYSALARGWNCTVEEAKQRSHYQMFGTEEDARRAHHEQKKANLAKSYPHTGTGTADDLMKRDFAESDRPGTPEDGGQHAKSEPDLDQLERDLARLDVTGRITA